MPETLLHATCIALDGVGILIEGKPGAGKSDLALRLLDQPGCGHGETILNGRLVSDDQVLVERHGATLQARAPAAIRGLLEIRGLGIVHVATLESVSLKLVARLASTDSIERMPDLESSGVEILGIRLPLVLIDPLHPSAPARLRAAAVALAGQSAAGKLTA
jgi:serine kinase of HPr protein (carbohydrate metabolism regulator)